MRICVVPFACLLAVCTAAARGSDVDKAEYARALNALRAQLSAIDGIQAEYDHSYLRSPDEPQQGTVKARTRFKLEGDLLTPAIMQRRRCTILSIDGGLAAEDALYDGSYQWRRNEGSGWVRTADPTIPGRFPHSLVLPLDVQKLPSTSAQIAEYVRSCEARGDITHVALGKRSSAAWHEIWLDRTRGWPRRWTMHYPDGKTIVTEVQEFIERPLGGERFYFPAVVTVTHTYPDRAAVVSETLTVDSATLLLNPTFDADSFAAVPVPGDRIYDSDRQVFLDPLDFAAYGSATGASEVDEPTGRFVPSSPPGGISPIAWLSWSLVIGGGAVIGVAIWLRRSHG